MKEIGCFSRELLQTLSDEESRELLHCPVCGGAKGKGLIVCWTCFKYEEPADGVPPFKYFDGTWEAWTNAIVSVEEHEFETLMRR